MFDSASCVRTRCSCTRAPLLASAIGGGDLEQGSTDGDAIVADFECTSPTANTVQAALDAVCQISDEKLRATKACEQKADRNQQIPQGLSATHDGEFRLHALVQGSPPVQVCKSALQSACATDAKADLLLVPEEKHSPAVRSGAILRTLTDHIHTGLEGAYTRLEKLMPNLHRQQSARAPHRACHPIPCATSKVVHFESSRAVAPHPSIRRRLTSRVERAHPRELVGLLSLRGKQRVERGWLRALLDRRDPLLCTVPNEHKCSACRSRRRDGPLGPHPTCKRGSTLVRQNCCGED